MHPQPNQSGPASAKTVYNTLDVFTCSTANPESTVVVVLAQTRPSNGHHERYTWEISFIGLLNEFHLDYSDKMAQAFALCSAEMASSSRLSETAFYRYLNKRIDHMQPLSPHALSMRGIGAYSWLEADAIKIDAHHRSTMINRNGKLYYGQRLDSMHDIYRMVAESLEIKAASRRMPSTALVGRPYIELKGSIRLDHAADAARPRPTLTT
ncbi:hypothetical protein [Marinobacter sp. ELB17]|uniref:hypothetical protein n=1 Tax=Marinobacter sp. ELB17 TaxID=270374 RepID=UPI0000F3B38B|nr:hypothetical protein [Marinobacter sp. ELB17]EAZ98399.1 hypothetical protein MELB17_09238 [Marinobacter sp. ELB17]